MSSLGVWNSQRVAPVKIFGRLPKSVTETYDRILCRRLNVDIARKLLHIIVAAERPLSLKEMTVEIAIKACHHLYDVLELELNQKSDSAI